LLKNHQANTHLNIKVTELVNFFHTFSENNNWQTGTINFWIFVTSPHNTLLQESKALFLVSNRNVLSHNSMCKIRYFKRENSNQIKT